LNINSGLKQSIKESASYSLLEDNFLLYSSSVNGKSDIKTAPFEHF